MKKKSDLGSWFFIIFFIGLVILLTSGDIELGNYFGGGISINIKVLLDYLSAGLAFLTFGLLLLFFTMRSAGSLELPNDKPLLEKNKEDL